MVLEDAGFLIRNGAFLAKSHPSMPGVGNKEARTNENKFVHSSGIVKHKTQGGPPVTQPSTNVETSNKLHHDLLLNVTAAGHLFPAVCRAHPQDIHGSHGWWM